MFYVSTGDYQKKDPYQTCIDYYNIGIKNIELSGGIHNKDSITHLKKLNKKINFLIHNYFPPPPKPFVLNLASLNKEISLNSYNHAINAINYAVELNSPIYSFHGGYLIDPTINELGSKLNKVKLNNKIEAKKIFLENVNNLSDYALKKGLDLHIENNVLSLDNYNPHKSSPLLMIQASELIDLMENTPQNVNLLIDIGHLNVSSNSVNFDKIDFLNSCNKWIQSYHLSENSGFDDSNDKILDNSWFWKYLKKDVKFLSLEIYGISLDEMIDQLNLLKKKYEQL